MSKLNSAAAFVSCAVVFLTVAGAWAAVPENHAAVLAPVINDDTLAAAYVDVVPLDAAKIGELVSMLPKLPGAAQVEMVGAMIASTWAKSFQDAGGQGVYAVIGLGDVYFDGGPLIIATTRPGKNAQDVEQMIRAAIGQFGALTKEWDVQRKGETVRVGTKSTLARYASLRSSARNELIEALAKQTGDDVVAAVVFCPGSDYRRVSRELWPTLPGSLAPLRGELADRWLYFAATLNLPPNPKARIELQAKDPEAAQVFAQLWHNLPTETTEFGGNSKAKEQVKGYAQTLVDLLPAKLQATRVEIVVPTDESKIAKLRALFAEASTASMESSRLRIQMGRFKNIALGILNYESANKHLPASAIYDRDGRPLLSWRVAILPYLGQNELYKQFHLDEPWDSPHNRTLIEKMPSIYMNPGPNAGPLNDGGKTTCQVPVGPETVFFNKEGAKYRDIRDGTSHTILLVEVEPSRAVVWTKPEDWEADLNQPRDGLTGANRNSFMAAFADGHVEMIDLRTTADARLRALLTRAGREPGESD